MTPEERKSRYDAIYAEHDANGVPLSEDVLVSQGVPPSYYSAAKTAFRRAAETEVDDAAIKVTVRTRGEWETFPNTREILCSTVINGQQFDWADVVK